LSKSEYDDSTKAKLKAGLFDLMERNGIDTLVKSKFIKVPSVNEALPEAREIEIAYVYQVRKKYHKRNVQQISKHFGFSNVVELKMIDNIRSIETGLLYIFDRNRLMGIEYYKDSILIKKLNIEKKEVVDYIEYDLVVDSTRVIYSYDDKDDEVFIYFNPFHSEAEVVNIKVKNGRVYEVNYTLGLESYVYLNQKYGISKVINISQFVISINQESQEIFYKKISTLRK